MRTAWKPGERIVLLTLPPEEREALMRLVEEAGREPVTIVPFADDAHLLRLLDMKQYGTFTKPEAVFAALERLAEDLDRHATGDPVRLATARAVAYLCAQIDVTRDLAVEKRDGEIEALEEERDVFKDALAEERAKIARLEQDLAAAHDELEFPGVDEDA